MGFHVCTVERCAGWLGRVAANETDSDLRWWKKGVHNFDGYMKRKDDRKRLLSLLLSLMKRSRKKRNVLHWGDKVRRHRQGGRAVRGGVRRLARFTSGKCKSGTTHKANDNPVGS